MMKNYLLAFAAIIAYKLISNLVCYFRCQHYEKKYQEYVAHQQLDFAEYTYPIKKLFQRTGVAGRSFQDVQPLGFGKVSTGRARVVDNMNVLDTRVVQNMLNMFSIAKGTYRSRALEVFNPMYWIECVIFLPKKVMEYFGVNGEKTGVKIFQVLYWILAPVLVAFRTQLYEYIAGLLGLL